MQPSVELDDGYEPGKDAEVKVELEVLPEVPTPSIDGLKLERLTVAAPTRPRSTRQLAEVRRAAEELRRRAEGQHEAKTGDLVVMDFVGKVDGDRVRRRHRRATCRSRSARAG